MIFAFDGWAMVELARAGSTQAPVWKPRELAQLIEDAGVPAAEAAEIAQRAWRTRPSDAAFGEAGVDESVRASVGLPAWAALVVFPGIIVAGILILGGQTIPALIAFVVIVAALVLGLLRPGRR